MENKYIFTTLGLSLIYNSLLYTIAYYYYSLNVNSPFPLFFFTWNIFMMTGHLFFIGLAFIHISYKKFRSQLFNPKIWFGLGSIFLLFSIIGLLSGLTLGFASFRTWIIWSTLFLSILYLYGKCKLDHFSVVFLSFLTVVIATELWELPILLKFVFVPPNPARYPPIEIVTRFIILNTKLVSAPLLVAWARFHGWQVTKIFLVTTTVVILTYIPLILTGWEEWWYRLIMFPLAFAFIRGFSK